LREDGRREGEGDENLEEVSHGGKWCRERRCVVVQRKEVCSGAEKGGV
jgi:hypothetical protein